MLFSHFIFSLNELKKTTLKKYVCMMFIMLVLAFGTIQKHRFCLAPAVPLCEGTAPSTSQGLVIPCRHCSR